MNLKFAEAAAGTKDRIFQLRYNEEEAEMLKKVAENKGLSASVWLRMTIREAYERLPEGKK